MIIKKFRIPKTVRLPGVLVQVRLVPASELSPDADAEWTYDERGGIINILESVPLARQRYLLLHELHHAIADAMHTALQDLPKDVAP